MAKIIDLIGYGYVHWCPGCGENHLFHVHKPSKNGSIWRFNGDFNHPTFSPSMVVSIPEVVWEGGSFPARRCHYLLRGGKITYLSDTTHHLSGTTIELPDFPS